MSAVRHIVSFQLKDDVTPEQRQELLTQACAMQTMDGLKDVIKSIAGGEDIGIPHPAGPNATVALMVDFASKEDYELYANHPSHMKVIADCIKPAMVPGTRTAIQMFIPEVNKLQ
mmetsp:Transcript_3321/g.4471  ORF Transcript_3321/g.4471 Transcript_3321/m.4471 type:complete len:115 (-) Transcript_3321:281-625(-)|eukprot:CAMPEP_0194752158 /NCGR_PEP_ID=MMETSP0323_2-20130528/5984_1 /TAXON_ID=2866 ORGANISM="Crypthecodinium cohnii, Strain Seligo" /NCGR_SAMPLE_ID=MMETSP0323_2 /ASSEMBLY_ACC=CAM_ASM_000346 /LENGTH=114 /DNA_ID=CAMNT_0039668907 /DNA_START=81 /DNA_END=425 /DNA_ORIENTATION=-